MLLKNEHQGEKIRVLDIKQRMGGNRMKKLLKRVFLTITVFIMLFLTTITGEAASIVRKGCCGENMKLTWTLDSKGKLTIKGRGNMDNMLECGQGIVGPWFDEVTATKYTKVYCKTDPRKAYYSYKLSDFRYDRYGRAYVKKYRNR